MKAGAAFVSEIYLRAFALSISAFRLSAAYASGNWRSH